MTMKAIRAFVVVVVSGVETFTVIVMKLSCAGDTFVGSAAQELTLLTDQNS